MTEQTILVTWYDHNCDWITKHCDEYHTRSALVPVEVLAQYATGESRDFD